MTILDITSAVTRTYESATVIRSESWLRGIGRHTGVLSTVLKASANLCYFLSRQGISEPWSCGLLKKSCHIARSKNTEFVRALWSKATLLKDRAVLGFP